jgi:hypothetical protein
MNDQALNTTGDGLDAVADTNGHMIAEYDDGFGNKGRPTQPTPVGRDPVDVGTQIGRNLKTLFGSVFDHVPW